MTKTTKTQDTLKSKEGLIIHLSTQYDDDEPIYMTGNFNAWKVADPRYRFQQITQKKYQLKIPAGQVLTFPLEFKFIKGGWDQEELDESGNRIDNRVLEKPIDKLNVFVPLWERANKTYDSDLLPKIVIISNHFEIPQLIKTRRITALLPHDYYENTEKRYPVLYLQDGQNLFDDYAPYGSWGVDKRLAQLSAQGFGDIIIVAIDHGKEERIAEFTPSLKNATLKKSDGKKYIRFLADTLKPHIDKNFRTLTGPEHTGIGGSSMGGLISIYAGMTYPEVYSKLMIFSPSLWVMSKMEFGHLHDLEETQTKIYLYAGGKESKNMVSNVRRFEKAATTRPNVNYKLSFDPEGVHSEYHWGVEFPKAIKWLFFNKKNIAEK